MPGRPRANIFAIDDAFVEYINPQRSRDTNGQLHPEFYKIALRHLR